MRRFFYTKEKNGLELVCDHCGDSVLVKRLVEYGQGEDSNDEVYEKPPTGWLYSGDTQVTCPNCALKLAFKNRPEN
jgi:DNA-directed RNA polymerase subunit RPC12/RpoP